MDLQQRANVVGDVARSSEGELANRIRREFLEMPGLALTRPQAQRLWNLDQAICDEILAVLVRDSFLVQSRAGAYLRRSDR